MDYMNLGIKSRKTGLNVKNDIKKDEYSMENLDDFFQDNDTTNLSDKNQRSKKRKRNSSLLSFQSIQNGENILPSDLINSPTPSRNAILNVDEKENDDSSRFKRPTRTSILSQATDNNLYDNNYNNNDDADNVLGTIQEGNDDGNYMAERRLSDISNRRKRRSTFFRNRFDSINTQKSNDIDTTSIVNEKSYPVNNYLQDDDDAMPALTESEMDNTVDNTSLNTSDNYVLEDELETDEDRSYIHGPSSDLDSNGSGSSNSDDDDHKELNYDNIKTDSYGLYDSESDDDAGANKSILEQASQVVNDDSLVKSDGLRRSTRVKIPTLDYWRNEKVIYTRKSIKPVLEISKIVTFDEESDEEEESSKKKKSRLRNQISDAPIGTVDDRGEQKEPTITVKNKTRSKLDKNIIGQVRSGEVIEAQWLKNGILQGDVKVTKNRMSLETLAFAPNISQSEITQETIDEKFSLEIMFDKYKKHFASGKLRLPKNGNRNPTDSLNTFMTFYLIQGTVTVNIGETTFVATTGSTFQIPAYNKYSFTNIGNNEAKMFFVQVCVSDEELISTYTNDDADALSSSSHTSSNIRSPQMRVHRRSSSPVRSRRTSDSLSSTSASLQ
ncbi:Mif2p NDAI_0K02090 [Naumovozyma dairenensis CBS 421]|uniref:CENP-C homolog n=1 Tax=Naumovozyma dairenensis (strain ATCC 10597 / BCRC 20456 / CBS 421 / NBRC 0211 / NRRL Y-12639) TaxID=1071378 RepID=G0WHY9_NAUDC|nr:hypothetical protein NDAI_0K02090 [Naumovozyma dairenensis CBS 421]CCD27400.1 hypothetical protein NDAI_0K02090 [Naumovozyma dairenensis CBS 421]